MIVCLSATSSAWAWGRLAHRTVARLAWEELSAAAKSAIADLLEPGVSLADVATWADEQRSPGSAPWHYVNVPIAESRYDPRFCPAAGWLSARSRISEVSCRIPDPKDLRSTALTQQGPGITFERIVFQSINTQGHIWRRYCTCAEYCVMHCQRPSRFAYTSV